MDEIPITARPVDRFSGMVNSADLSRLRATMQHARHRLAGRTLWHVNSTAEGGGVAEMLQSILGYPLDGGLCMRWVVIDGDAAFFEVTKRLHHLLHGAPGDHGQLGDAERHTYESTLRLDADRLAGLVRPGDVVILHDPQTLGMAPVLTQAGCKLIWTCHIGADESNRHTQSAWRFLSPYLPCTDAQILSRSQYACDLPDASHAAVIPPCIDAFSPKNQPLDEDTVAAILNDAGIIPAQTMRAPATFVRRDETRGEICSSARMIQDASLPPTANVIAQVSRWDPLKDHLGVLNGFCRYGPSTDDAHLVLAGPEPESVVDDPESQHTFAQLREAWSALELAARQRTHIACLPMRDVDENGAIVNALQRRADIVVQKSLAEGFGLTVAEAMWKGRPTVASRLGGIQDQIEPDVSGVLIEPTDLAQFGRAVTSLLHNRRRAHALGTAARERVRQEYLAPRYLDRLLQLALRVGSL